jgi:hypothetical protein
MHTVWHRLDKLSCNGRSGLGTFKVGHKLSIPQERVEMAVSIQTFEDALLRVEIRNKRVWCKLIITK